jgi:hypothetical protein
MITEAGDRLGPGLDVPPVDRQFVEDDGQVEPERTWTTLGPLVVIGTELQQMLPCLCAPPPRIAASPPLATRRDPPPWE